MKITTRHLITGMLLTLISSQSYGVSPYPGKITITQANGSTVAVTRVGDGFCNAMLTDDGYPLIYNPVSRNHEYAVCRDGKLECSGVAVTPVQTRSEAEKTFVATLDQRDLKAALDCMWISSRPDMTDDSSGMAGTPQRIVRINDVPTKGTLPVLVILVDFADKKFSDNAGTPDPAAYYDRFFHEKGFSEFGARGSAYDYYHDASCGRYDPQFHVYGPVQVSGSYKDYGGATGSEYTYKMVVEAVRLADAQYDVDFSKYDTDGDGKVDNVYCLYAGYGRADSGESESIWPHSYELHYKDATVSLDGVSVDRYTVSQQVNGQTHNPVGIGTFVHEFGHVLGLADHYNNSSSFGNLTNNVGHWDLMSSGSYNDNQNCPPTYSAFERYSLGWTEPVELDLKKPAPVEMTPYIETGQCYRVSVTSDDKEYFLIENRQQKGWDEFLPGHGIVVWHIEENQLIWDKNEPNADQSHQCVDIVEAARQYTTDGSSSDPFPGNAGVTSYSFTDWSSNPVFGFDWVDEVPGGNCRFLLTNSGYVLPSPRAEIVDIMGTSATLKWAASEFAKSYEITLKRDGQELLSRVINDSESTQFTELVPETEYMAVIKARLNSLSSDDQEVRFTTLPLQLEEKKAEALDAADVTESSFMARWNPMPGASAYSIVLYTTTHDGEGLLTHGFDEFSTSNPHLPEGWSVTEKQGRNENDFGQAAPSIRLRDENASLTVCVPGQKIDAIELWAYPNKAGLVLTAERFADGQWSEIWNYTAYDKRVITPNIETDGADSVRFVISREEGVTGGFILIDDITLHYVYDRFQPLRSIDVAAEGQDAFINLGEVYGYHIDGLDPDVVYGYDVCGIDGTRRSIPSDIIKVEDKGISGLKDAGMQESESVPAIYNLQGIRINRALRDLPEGIYIVNGKKVAI